MGRAGRIGLVCTYLLGSALLFSFYAEERSSQGESGSSLSVDWVTPALFVSSVVIGALIGRLWVLLVPLSAAFAIGWPIAWSTADGHALADVLIWMPLEAILNTAAAGVGVGMRRFASRFARPS